MKELVIILYVVWAVLCLILFFKVWRMCNDVRCIKNKLIKNDDIEATIEFLLRIGEKEKAKEVLLDRILTNDMIFDRESSMTQEVKIENVFRIYEEELQKLGYSIPKQKEEKNEVG